MQLAGRQMIVIISVTWLTNTQGNFWTNNGLVWVIMIKIETREKQHFLLWAAYSVWLALKRLDLVGSKTFLLLYREIEF